MSDDRDERDTWDEGWPPPRDDPDEEPSHPWARRDRIFDWDEERVRQQREGERWVESEDDRREREASILPRGGD